MVGGAQAALEFQHSNLGAYLAVPALAGWQAAASRGRGFAEATGVPPTARTDARARSWLGLHEDERFEPESSWPEEEERGVVATGILTGFSQRK